MSMLQKIVYAWLLASIFIVSNVDAVPRAQFEGNLANLCNANKNLKKDKELVLGLLSEYFNPVDFQCVDPSLRKDKDVVKKAVRRRPYSFVWADDSLKKDRKFILDISNPENLQMRNDDNFPLCYADPSLQKDKKFILKLMKKNPFQLECADESLKKDKNFILSAIKKYKNPRLLFYAHPSLRKNRDLIFKVIDETGRRSVLLLSGRTIHVYKYGYLENEFKKDKEVVLAIMKHAGNNASRVMQFSDRSLRKDKDVALAALKVSSGKYRKRVLRYLDKSLRNDPDIKRLIND